MRLLLDQNLSSRLPRPLHDLYPGSIHVREVGLQEAEDPVVWDYARERGGTFKIIRHRKPVGCLTAQPPQRKLAAQRYAWDEHFRRVRARGKFPPDAADWERRPGSAR